MKLNRILISGCLVFVLLAAGLVVEAAASPYAVEVVDSNGPFGGSPYDDPSAVLGKPTTVFYDSWSGATSRIKMVEPAYNTDADYRGLIVSYGTMSRVCRTAIDMLKEDGIEIGMIRPQTLFPFPDQAVADAANASSCTHVLSIEMSMGQMVEDVKLSVGGKVPVYHYGMLGGKIHSPEDVLSLSSVLKKS